MDFTFSDYPNFNDQTLLLDILNEYPSADPIDDLSLLDPNPMNSVLSSSSSSVRDDGELCDSVIKHINKVLMEDDVEPRPWNGSEHYAVGSRGKKSHQREDKDLEDGRSGRSNNQSAVYREDVIGELSDIFGKALLGEPVKIKVCKNGANTGLQNDVQVSQKACGKKRGNKKDVIDLRRLLISCAEAVAVDDRGTASELLKQIRKHSSPLGDYSQRLAHCFANALES